MPLGRGLAEEVHVQLVGLVQRGEAKGAHLYRVLGLKIRRARRLLIELGEEIHHALHVADRLVQVHVLMLVGRHARWCQQGAPPELEPMECPHGESRRTTRRGVLVSQLQDQCHRW